MFSAAQLKVFLRALVTIDPYAFDDVAEQLAANDENNQQSSEDILLSTIDGLPDDKLTGFALRSSSPHTYPFHAKTKSTFFAEAEAAFAPTTTQGDNQQENEDAHADQGRSERPPAKKKKTKKEVAA